MKLKIISKLLLALFLILVAFMGICEAVSEDISGGLVRLHIIANSNSEEDQSVKLKVRDEIIKYAQNFENVDLEFVNKNISEIEAISNRVLSENGFSYKSHIETGKFNFPTKTYENITLPKGEYNAVKIVLGEGYGENWWCVMFPPLCFTDSAKGELTEENKKKLKDTMNKSEYEMITGEKIELKPAFRALELWAEFKEKTKKIF